MHALYEQGDTYHRGRVVPLHPAKHDTISQHPQLAEGPLSQKVVLVRCDDGIQNLLVEDRNMLESSVTAVRAAVILVDRPVQRRAVTRLAEVICERRYFQKAKQRDCRASQYTIRGGKRLICEGSHLQNSPIRFWTGVPLKVHL